VAAARPRQVHFGSRTNEWAARELAPGLPGWPLGTP